MKIKLYIVAVILLGTGTHSSLVGWILGRDSSPFNILSSEKQFDKLMSSSKEEKSIDDSEPFDNAVEARSDIPFELTVADEKFIADAQKYTDLSLSQRSFNEVRWIFLWILYVVIIIWTMDVLQGVAMYPVSLVGILLIFQLGYIVFLRPSTPRWRCFGRCVKFGIRWIFLWILYVVIRSSTMHVRQGGAMYLPAIVGIPLIFSLGYIVFLRPSTPRWRCFGRCVDGSRCPNATRSDSIFCWQHG